MTPQDPTRTRAGAARRLLVFLGAVALVLGVAVLWTARDESAGEGERRFVLHLGAEWEAYADPSARGGGETVTVPEQYDNRRPRSRVLYRKRFFLPRAWKPMSPCALLRMESVTCVAAVTVNGRAVGLTELPDVPCELDVTGALRWDAENEVVIDVRNLEALPLYRDWTGADRDGAWKIFSYWRQARLSGPVTLVVTPRVRVARALVLPRPSAKKLEARIFVENRGRQGAAAVLRCRVLDGRRCVLDLGARDVVLSGGERTAMEISHEWSGAKSWNTWDRGAAHRYCLETELRVGEKMRDVVYSDFGWREVSVKDGRLLLNGRPFKFWALRWEPVDVSPREGAELLLKIRGASLNALHPHYGTLPEEVYERADEMGFAVVPELHCCGKWNAVFSGVPEARAAAFFEAVFRTWYEELFNHPSIVTWCQEDLGAPLAREACARTLGADPTRPVMYRDLLPLVYDDALACMNFQELQKEKRSLFIQEFHQEREELIPPEARTLFLERLDGALFTTGFLGAPLMGRLFDGLLPAGGGQGPPLRARVVVKSSGAGGLLYLEDGARPGVLDGYVEESRTDLGFRAPGTLRLGKFPSPAAPIRIAPASARSGTVSPLEVALPE